MKYTSNTLEQKATLLSVADDPRDCTSQANSKFVNEAIPANVLIGCGQNGSWLQPYHTNGCSKPTTLRASQANLPPISLGNPETEEQPFATPLPEVPPVDATPNLLPNPKGEQYSLAFSALMRQDLHHWTLDGNPYSPEQTAILDTIAQVWNDSWHTRLRPDLAKVLTTWDFQTIVTTIRRLRAKVGFAELAVMILLGLIVKNKLYKKQGCNSESGFFTRYSDSMGISKSKARDYSTRGLTFLEYRADILNGVGPVPGISIEDFVNSHLSKLSIYDKAVKKHGREQALFKLNTMTFREFQAELKEPKPKTAPSGNTRKADVPDVDREQKAMLSEMALSPSEKRLLHIIAKGGIVHLIHRLNGEQLEKAESRIRQRRVEILEENLKMAPIPWQRESYDPNNPLAISDDLYGLTNVNDILLRIRSGLALMVPARRVIAILTYRLFSWKESFEFHWKRPSEGVEYASFRDFAMNELGMGEEYRDYIAVGKVLWSYHQFLDGLSDMDTEDMFFKLRYIPKALQTHKGDECLVLARLRSLTVREFKQFSELPGFEVTFSKKLTKKQLDLFHYHLECDRNKGRLNPNQSCEFIEAFSNDEFSMIDTIVREIIEETEAEPSVPAVQPDALPLEDTSCESVDLLAA